MVLNTEGTMNLATGIRKFSKVDFCKNLLKALTDHFGGGSRVDSFDPQW